MPDHEKPEDVERDDDAGESPCRNGIGGVPAQMPDNKEEDDGRAARKKWRRVKCSYCSGYGVISCYTRDGSDFLGPGDCPVCGGSGCAWESPNRKFLAEYPGGRIIG